jgi:hypothetical protein
MLPIGSKVCQYSACGEYFSTPTWFDKHRSGPYTARICLNPADIGLIKGANGRWCHPSRGQGRGPKKASIEH